MTSAPADPALDYSIVIPAWNEEATLPATLGALRAAMDELGRPSELIVVDDGATDRTREVASSHGARVERVRLRHIAAVRNAGARVARGTYLIFVDADTVVPSETLRAALAELDLGAVGGGAPFDPDLPMPFPASVYLGAFLFVWKRLGYAAGCFLYCTKGDFDAVGGFDERYFAGEEVWLSRALRERGRFVIVSPPVITSARKLRTYRGSVFLARSMMLLLRGPRALRQREGLGLWYEGRRERMPPAPRA